MTTLQCEPCDLASSCITLSFPGRFSKRASASFANVACTSQFLRQRWLRAWICGETVSFRDGDQGITESREVFTVSANQGHNLLAGNEMICLQFDQTLPKKF